MFERLKNYIHEYERIIDKTNQTGNDNKLTQEEWCYLKSVDLHMALALLGGSGCNARKVAQIILIETEK